MSHRLHDGRSVAMTGGMVLLGLDHRVDPYDGQRAYHRVPLAGLVRLAAFLGVVPEGPFVSEGAQRHALVRAIARAEACLAKGPKKNRWPTPITP